MTLPDPISFSLPYPPSANGLWRAVNGRTISSRAYRYWMKTALAHISAVNERPTVEGPYSLTVVAQRPDRRRRDIGNIEKSLSDALVHGKVVADDCNAERITLCWSDMPPDRSARVIVRVQPLAPCASSLRAEQTSGEKVPA